MKHILKRARVNAWAVGEQMLVLGEVDATDDEIQAAIDAEEELDTYRRKARWN